MRRLIWGFDGRTYHIVGNLVLRLNYVLFMVYTDYGCGGHLDDVTWTINANLCDAQEDEPYYCRANQEWQ